MRFRFAFARRKPGERGRALCGNCPKMGNSPKAMERIPSPDPPRLEMRFKVLFLVSRLYLATGPPAETGRGEDTAPIPAHFDASRFLGETLVLYPGHPDRLEGLGQSRVVVGVAGPTVRNDCLCVYCGHVLTSSKISGKRLVGGNALASRSCGKRPLLFFLEYLICFCGWRAAADRILEVKRVC